MSPCSNSLEQLRRQRRVEHLHRLGPRAIDELLADVANRIGGWPTINLLLVEYERRLTPAMLRAVGADRFPRRPLRVVPRDLGDETEEGRT